MERAMDTASRDDRVRRMIEDPARYFNEARDRAALEVAQEMDRERQSRGHVPKKKTTGS